MASAPNPTSRAVARIASTELVESREWFECTCRSARIQPSAATMGPAERRMAPGGRRAATARAPSAAARARAISRQRSYMATIAGATRSMACAAPTRATSARSTSAPSTRSRAVTNDVSLLGEKQAPACRLGQQPRTRRQVGPDRRAPGRQRFDRRLQHPLAAQEGQDGGRRRRVPGLEFPRIVELAPLDEGGQTTGSRPRRPALGRGPVHRHHQSLACAPPVREQRAEERPQAAAIVAAVHVQHLPGHRRRPGPRPRVASVPGEMVSTSPSNSCASTAAAAPNVTMRPSSRSKNRARIACSRS